MKNYLILFLSFLIIGCAQIVTRPPITQYNPQKHARIRVILEREKGEQRQSYTNFKVVENGKYKEYQEMLLDDFEEHHVVYKVEPDEIIAIAYKNKTIPYKLIEYYDWQQMNYLIEEEND